MVSTKKIDGMTVVSIARRALVAEELWLCINQVGRPESALAGGLANPSALGLLTSLLRVEGSFAPIDLGCERNELLRVLVFPELAFGLDDWQTINDVVDTYPYPLLLVAGFGMTKAERLKSKVDFIGDNIPGNRNVNYGCVWLRMPASAGKASCSGTFFFCKNFMQQSMEVAGLNPLAGDQILAIEFEDLTVFPLICADLLADSQAGAPNALDRIRRFVGPSPKMPILITGSLYQPAPWHEIWASKMDRVVDSVPCVLALANVADTKLADCYTNDTRRNLSGVYTSRSNHKDPASFNMWSSARHEATLTGQPIRTSAELSVAGKVRLGAYSPSTGQHLWIPQWGVSYSGGELVSQWTHCAQMEMPRLLARTRHFPPCQSEKLTEVENHLKTADKERPAALLSKLLWGPIKPAGELDPCVTERSNKATEEGLCVVDALKRSPSFGWPSDKHVPLKLTFTGNAEEAAPAINTYIWRSSEVNWLAMTSELVSYAQDPIPRPAMVVVAGDSNHAAPEIEQIQNLCDAASPALDAEARDVASPRGMVNRIAVIPFIDAVKLSGSIKDGQEFSRRTASIVANATNQLNGGNS